jgi:hypothetical protein
MLLVVLWAMLVIGALWGAGYSHYRYRVRHNQYYERLFAKNHEESYAAEIPHHSGRLDLIPVVTFVVVCLLVPMSLVI